jgi:aminopeptidase N
VNAPAGVPASLTRDEAARRAALVAVRGYEIDIDLTTGPDAFRVRTRIRFNCREPGGSTFIEHVVPRMHSIALNGTELAVERAFRDGRIALDGLAGENEVVVIADAAYSPSLEGLQRSVDPEDGEVYVFGQAFLDFGRRIFACFDQPDLKAPFSVSVTAPTGWTVLSNGPGSQVEPGRWTFAPTPPLPTYLFALGAGPWHSVTTEHDGIPLGIWCRRSLSRFLDAEELFDLTSRGIDYYTRLFGAPFPFAKYDQLFMPETTGAMENAGLVTYTESFIFRSPVTDGRRRQRAYVFLHELAHMWFGDLVTMRWWEDLWLNESFATYLGYRTLTDATRHATAWTDFALGGKAWGYRQDELPTTHPVSADVPDTAAALLNFDGISYSKGAAVIKQLAAWVGGDAFEAGLQRYIAEHSYGTTSLGDLLGAMETASERSLGSWATEWLQTAGIATLRPDLEIGADGRYTAAAVVQTAPVDQPTLRSQRIAIGLFERDGERLVRRDRLEVDVEGVRTPIPELVARPAPHLLLLNDDDLTWAKVRLDDRSLASVREGAIPRIDEPLARALLWTTVLDMTRDAELRVADCLRIVLDGVAGEPDTGIAGLILYGALDAVDRFGRPAQRKSRRAAFSARAGELLAAAPAGSDAQLLFARAFIDSATTDRDLVRLQAWLRDDEVPDGLELGPDQRWAAVQRLAVTGRIGSSEIDAEAERDPTTAGAQSAATARAGVPTPAAKAAAWEELVAPDGPTLGIRRAIAAGFWQHDQVDSTRRYLDRYVADIGALFRGPSPELARSIADRAFPETLVEEATVAVVDRALGESELDPSFRRILIESRADLLRALHARELDEPD